MRVLSVNQDRGITPGRSKGAVVHLEAMRTAFRRLGCEVVEIDEPDDRRLDSRLAAATGVDAQFIYERYALGKSAAARFASARDIPHVLEVNAPLADEASRFRGCAATVDDEDRDLFTFSTSACVLAVSGAVADYAEGRGARPERIMVCPNGIDGRRFHAGVDGERVRRAHVPDDAFVLGFHGRVRPWHGFGHLVEVVRRLRERGTAAHLLVAGAGELAELATLPENAYTRLGWLPHDAVPEVVAAFDALPLTYPVDLTCYFSPLKLAEAMACGVVPVVPDLGDLPKAVDHGRTGLVYPAGEFHMLTDLLQALAARPAFRRELGKAAARSASERSWTAIAKRVLDSLDLPVPQPLTSTAPHG